MKKDYDGAIVNYNKAIELKPDYAEAYNSRGNAYYSKGDNEQAIKDYTKSIELNNPLLSMVYRNRAISYEKKGDLVKARADRQKADELEKKS